MNITELARKFFEIKTRHEELSTLLKELNAEWTDIESKLLDAMAEEGVRSVSIDGLGLFSMSAKNYLSVNAANKPQFYEYLKASGNGALLKEDVNPRTLTAFLKGHLDDLIRQHEKKGLDSVDARHAALKFLNEHGANYFTDRGVSFRSKGE